MSDSQFFLNVGEPDPEAPKRHPAFVHYLKLIREEKIMRRWGLGIAGAAAVLAFSPFFPTGDAVARAAATQHPSGEPGSEPQLDLTPWVEVAARFLAATRVEEK